MRTCEFNSSIQAIIWMELFILEVRMLVHFARAAILFIMTVLLMRIMGKRQVAQLQPYELVLAILLADLAAAPMQDSGIPLLYGIVPMLALVCLHTAITLCCMKSERLRRIIDGQSYSVIRGGKLDNSTLDKLGFSISDLLEELRTAGYARMEDINEVILETSGKLSVFEHENLEPVTCADMSIEKKPRGVPLPLILSGQLQRQNLTKMNVSEAWLTAKLTKAGAPGVRSIALCSLDAAGTLVIFQKGNTAAPSVYETRENA